MMISKIGFAGTRRGMTAEQDHSFRNVFAVYAVTEFHHGCCMGADEQAAWIVDDSDWPKGTPKIIGHPGYSAAAGPSGDLGLGPRDETRDPKPYFDRNRDIVDETDLLIATPWQTTRPPPKTGGGTWFTINYAEKRGMRVLVLWPNGLMDVIDRAEHTNEKPARS